MWSKSLCGDCRTATTWPPRRRWPCTNTAGSFPRLATRDFCRPGHDERAADDFAGENLFHAVWQPVERHVFRQFFKLIDAPRAGKFLPHFQSLRPRALGRVDSRQRHAAQYEGMHRKWQFRSGHQSAGGDAAAVLHRAKDRRQRLPADRVDRGGPARRKQRSVAIVGNLAAADDFRRAQVVQ